MSRDDFVNCWLNEVTGLLLAAYHAEAEAGYRKMGSDSLAKDGRFFRDQMNRARSLLQRMHDDLTPPGPIKQNGQQKAPSGKP